jgi:putative ABC transport system substrate-binding protein
VVCAALGAGPAAAGPPPDGRAPLITVLLSQTSDPYQQTLAGFRRAFAGADPAPEIRVIDLNGGDEVAAARPAAGGGARHSLVLAIGARAARAAERYDSRAPLVVAMAADPALLERGAGKPLCGVGLEFPYALQFQALREIAPKVKTVGVLFESGNRAAVARAEAAARDQGLLLVRAEIGSVKEIPDALEGLIGRVDALWAIPDGLVFSRETSPYIILQTLRRRVPFMGFSQSFVKAGALVSLYPDFEDIGLQAGGMAREILAGRRAAGGGIVSPRKAQLAVNLRVADVIGLPVPPAVRRRASTVYE